MKNYQGMTTDQILVHEIGRRAPLFSGWAVRRIAKSLRTETHSQSMTLPMPASDVFTHAQRTLEKLGRLLETEKPALRAVVGSGSMNLNPAVVELMIQEAGSTHSLVRIAAAAKEGMVKQQTASKAIQRVVEALSK